MKKFNYLSVSWSILSTVLVFAFALAPLGVFGASTLGTNMSTTGTFTQTVGSATAARFQNAAGTVTVLHVDTTNARVGVGNDAPATTFEVQGTASASYFFTINTLQAGGTFAAASVAYSRFGAGTTGYSSFVSAADDLLITGSLEVDSETFFDSKVGVGAAPATKFEVQGTASASYFFTTGTLQAGGTFAAASVAYSRFGAGTTGYSADVDAANDLLITGALEVDGNAFFDGKVSVSGNFETSGRVRAGNASHSYTGSLNLTKTLVVGSATASASNGRGYVAEFVAPSTATVSLLFGGSTASSKGTCFQMKNTQGVWVYFRIKGTASSTLDITTTRCN